MPQNDLLIATYLDALLAGASARLLSGWSGTPEVDDPIEGHVRGATDLERFVRERRAWLVQRSAHIEAVRTTHTTQSTVFEALLHLLEPVTELPIAVVGDHAAGKLSAIRVYHSLWPLEGAHRVRPPLLQRDPSLLATDVVAEYQRALAAGDVDAIVATFEPDGYFREPAGGEWYYRGHARLREFMAHILGTGGIRLEYCSLTDDGVACAIEFNAVRFGPHTLQPQAGVAVYERGPGGKLRAARIYDDVNVEALAAG
jgi:hypothetical protein